MIKQLDIQDSARFPYRNNTCINKCTACSVNAWVLFRYDSLCMEYRTRTTKTTFVLFCTLVANMTVISADE